MNESKDKSVAGAQRQNRRMILWLVCGGYLLYLAFQLGKSLYDGTAPAGAETYISWGGCIVFGVVGLALLVLSIRLALGSFKDSVKAMDEAEAAGSDGEEQEVPR